MDKPANTSTVNRSNQHTENRNKSRIMSPSTIALLKECRPTEVFSQVEYHCFSKKLNSMSLISLSEKITSCLPFSGFTTVTDNRL